MRHEDLPERWKLKLRNYLAVNGSAKSDRLGASDFPLIGSVRIEFEDDSRIEFRNAFVIQAPEFREVGVFTEHCGYHIFPLYDGLDISVEATTTK